MVSTTPLVGLTKPLQKPMREIGGFIALALDTFIQALRPPFFWREIIEQCWFIARVATLPAFAQSVTFNGMVVFLFGVAATSFGAGDTTGAASGLATVSQIGPVTTVFVLSGAAATAMCADLGARTIREELDAMRVLGIDPIHRLVVPRVTALLITGNLINGVVIIAGLCADYLFSVFALNGNPGAFASSLTLLTNATVVLVSFIKASVFGMLAGLIACYKGITAGGGPQGVGNAVNETVVYTFMALLIVNIIISVLTATATLAT
ncbi:MULTISPECIES: MlaE family ABC transporter permease [Mycobacterium]|uniref:ABC transporter permease n=1 Tax=Mycobacterium kiyosense TaxID=2871094 RepID=A0A9P3Q485_9MYCO|nr:MULTISPECIES: ABC transporter permease [Mycobacterium]BDB44333.1 ABC transporter permease [Mycobacterium kiyosense]BDE15857.1 ABC transporter permease [Mycobacterium sp. 20KCMC460]GLB80749.1 ABC transporter permease [Mycobacterium kiyosense]GLB87513.1 ABC transporter permease [Mycobacterium kiyosense]GLB93229.1 ABC transporter permease [Mycobacterium kiyosense]